MARYVNVIPISRANILSWQSVLCATMYHTDCHHIKHILDRWLFLEVYADIVNIHIHIAYIINSVCVIKKDPGSFTHYAY